MRFCIIVITLFLLVKAQNPGIKELISYFSLTNCTRNPFGFCERGSVQVPSDLAVAVKQYHDQIKDTPIDQVTFLGTHNSFNNRAAGYGLGDLLINDLLKPIGANFIWAQQEYTMTDQLKMGIRVLHLDPHWVFGDFRLCHAGDVISDFNRIIEWLDSHLNITLNISSYDVGCSPFDQTVAAGLWEIRDWINTNPNEFLLIHWDDDDYTFNKTSEVETLISDILGDVLFYPNEKETYFPHSWPSLEQLKDMKKNVLIESESVYGVYSGYYIFLPLFEPGWPQNCVNNFTGNMTEWQIVGSESQIAGPFYNGVITCGIFTGENIRSVFTSGVSVIEMDQVSPELLRYAFGLA